MEIFLVVGGTFFLCFLIDKLFTRLFRSKPQHGSGKSVRLGKLYGIAGLLLTVLGVSSVLTGLDSYALLIWGGGLLIVVGIGLMVYFLTFGIYYDEEGFVVSTFGKKSTTYTYGQIEAQQLYANGNQTIVELHLADGRAVQLQSTMTGVYDFLDFAFARWCESRGVEAEDCPFHDPSNSCWFPKVEG
jgi:hypothetical protein